MTTRSNRWWQRLLMGLALCAALWGWPAQQAAAAIACSATMDPVSFGTVDLVTGGTYTASATLKYTCTNNANSVAYTRVCFNIGDGSGAGSTHTDWNPRAMLDSSGSNKLTYQLYQGATQTIWGSTNQTINDPYDVVVTVPRRSGGVDGSTNGSYTVRGVLSSGQSGVLPGAYSSSFDGNHTSLTVTAAASSLSSVPAACNTASSGTFAFTVTATVDKSCLVATNPLDFGSVDGVPSSANIDASTTLMVTCSKNTAYTVALLPSNGSTTGNGSMAAQNTAPVTGNTDAIPYQLFRNSARTQAWGNQIGTNTVAVTAASATANQTQTFTVYGRVPGLAAVQPDNYKDVVTVSVAY